MHKLPKTEKMENRMNGKKPYETPMMAEVELNVSSPLLQDSGEDIEFGMSGNPDGGIA